MIKEQSTTVTEETLNTQKGNLYKIDPRTIEVEPGFNVRQDFGDIEELAESIKENGIRVPLRGFKKGEKYVLTDGERRYRATMLLLEKGIVMRVPMILEQNSNGINRLIDMYVTNDGKRLNAVEESALVHRLINRYNLTPAEVSVKLGKTQAWVSNMLTLNTADETLKTQITKGEVAATVVLSELRSGKNKGMTAEEVSETLSKKVSDVVSTKEEKVGGKTAKVTAKDLKPAQPAKIGNDSSIEILRSMLFKEGYTSDVTADEESVEVVKFLKELLRGQLKRQDFIDVLDLVQSNED
jgi:ParB/RepB/Spo0J family partition protein